MRTLTYQFLNLVSLVVGTIIIKNVSVTRLMQTVFARITSFPRVSLCLGRQFKKFVKS